MDQEVEKEYNPVYARNTLEFVTVALEFCTLVETPNKEGRLAFIDKATKILPLLYLKAALLTEVEPDEASVVEVSVTEEMYESVRTRIAALLGEKDTYLETFHPDMQYSDTPVAVFISESLADVYQDVGNFVSLFRQGYDEVMLQALALCRVSFGQFWGGQALSALKALHAIRYDQDDSLEIEEEII